MIFGTLSTVFLSSPVVTFVLSTVRELGGSSHSVFGVSRDGAAYSFLTYLSPHSVQLCVKASVFGTRTGYFYGGPLQALTTLVF